MRIRNINEPLEVLEVLGRVDGLDVDAEALAVQSGRRLSAELLRGGLAPIGGQLLGTRNGGSMEASLAQNMKTKTVKYQN